VSYRKLSTRPVVTSSTNRDRQALEPFGAIPHYPQCCYRCERYILMPSFYPTPTLSNRYISYYEMKLFPFRTHHAPRCAYMRSAGCIKHGNRLQSPSYETMNEPSMNSDLARGSLAVAASCLSGLVVLIIRSAVDGGALLVPTRARGGRHLYIAVE